MAHQKGAGFESAATDNEARKDSATGERHESFKPSQSTAQRPTRKAFFAPLPLRAIADHRFTALHFRVLACVAWHDRLSRSRGKGAGCWASNKTLCAEIGCAYTNLSTAITELGKWGYLERHVHPLNKKRHVLNVIYENGSPTDELSAPTPIVRQPANNEAGIVRPKKNKAIEDQQDAEGNIFSEAEKIFCETENRFSEAASIGIDATLAILERKLKQGQCSREQIESGLAFCRQVMDTHGPGESAWQRAVRLLEEYEG